MPKERCKSCNSIIAERVEPCAEYPFGAIKITHKNWGEKHENFIPLSPMGSQKQIVEGNKATADA